MTNHTGYNIARPPLVLSRFTYGTVTERMVGLFSRERPSALIDLSGLLQVKQVGDGTNDPDISFVGQMRELGQKGWPDAFLFTANSAIPIADCVRGFFDELGRTPPTIDYIEANRRVAHNPNLIENQQSEVNRLAMRLADHESVCIIDELVATGQCLTYAADIVKRLGVKSIWGMRGAWYANARDAAIDKTMVTSKYRRKMHKLGVKACKLAYS